jgi:hypothetical protein
MDTTTFLAIAFALGFLFLLFWIPAEILRKAGFARGWSVLIVITNFLGLIALALIEWPIERELAWYRLKEGDGSEATITRAEHYAVDLEQAGEWAKAAEVFGTLARWSSGETSAYYQSCVDRLKEKMGRAGF